MHWQCAQLIIIDVKAGRFLDHHWFQFRPRSLGGDMHDSDHWH